MNPTKLLAVVMLASLMLSTGLVVNREHLREALRSYGLLGRALLANFVLVPLAGVLLVRLLHLNDEVATGFLLMAIAPGVPFLVRSGGRKKGGSLGFSIALAFIMPALSIVTFPLTARLVLPGSESAHLPITNVLVSLVLFQLLPLILGMLIVERAPALAGKLARPLNVLFAVSVVALLVALGPKLGEAIGSVYGSNGMLAMLAVTVLAVLFGYLLGGPATSYRRTLAIGTGLRNVGLASVVATSNFADTVVPATVVTYLLIQFVVCTLVGIYFTRAAKAGTTGVAEASA